MGWVLLVALGLSACPPPGTGGDGGEEDGGGEVGDFEPAVTAVGTPTGPSVQAVVGAAGGELVSADGRLTVLVPPGALTEDVTLELQPITNEAPGGIGDAWRLLPDVTFAAPIELRVTWTDEEIVGSGPDALGLAFQHDDGTWELLLNSAVDEEARTLITSVDHFTDFGFFEQFRLNPQTTTVHTGDELTLQVEVAVPPPGYRTAGPVFLTIRGPLPTSIAQIILGEWQVDGVVGGNGTVGTVASFGDQGRYTAPSAVPSPATVAVSVRVTQPTQPEIGAWLVSHVTIVEDVPLFGDVTFQTLTFGPTSGSGTIGWTLFEDNPDVQRYLPTGVLNATISPDDCDPVSDSFVIETGTPELPVATLVVYLGNSPFANTYEFAVSTFTKDITFQCGDPPAPITIPVGIAFGVGNCSGPFEPIPFTDPDVLEGTWDCALMETHVEWRFTRQPE